jgi:solute:Na+ symporter, SSS family
MHTNISLQPLDFTVIGIYLVALLCIGFWVSFKKSYAHDIFLGGRTFGWANVGFSIFGTNVSPSMMISSASIAYASGMCASNMEWLAWPFLILLAMVFIPHYLNTKVSTMPEFIDHRFGSACRNFLSWYTILATLILHLGGLLFAGGLLLSQILHWPLWASVSALMLISASFTTTGGLAAVVWTDTYQSILMIGGSALLTVIAFVKIGSLQNLVCSVPTDYWNLFRPTTDPIYPWHAVLLGYPVGGIWFWCTDQTIVQRVLGARDIRQGQLGCVFLSFLKVLIPFIFFVPGIMCKILYPNLANPDEAYATLVTNLIPTGLVGLMVSVLIASLISSTSGGLNSLSTVFTLDIYAKHIRPTNTTQNELRWIGRIVTVTGAMISVSLALLIASVKGMDIFSLLLSIISFLAPPLAAVFLVGVVWKRATSTAALLTFILGGILSLTVGVLYLAHWPSKGFYPHFMLVSFYIFAFLILFMVFISLLTKTTPSSFPTLLEHLTAKGNSSRSIWYWWIAVAAMMVGLYLIFNNGRIVSMF